MPVEVYISRYDDKLVEQSISLEEWENCVKEIENIKLVKDEDGSLRSVDTLCESLNDWIPIFWLNDNGNGSIRSMGFFNYPESYIKAIEIAVFLQVFIYGEEGCIFYLPGYGIMYDDCEPDEQILITIDDLIENEVYEAEDFKQEIEVIIDLKKFPYSEKTKATSIEIRDNKYPKAKYFEYNAPRKKWWQFWK